MPIRTVCFLALVFIAQSGNAQQTGDTPSGSRQLELNLEAFPDNAKPDNGKNEELQLNLEQFDEQPSSEPTLQNGQGKQLELNLEQFDQADQNGEENLELDLEQFDKSGSNKEKKPELNLEQFDNTDNSMNAEAADTVTKQTGAPVYNTRFIIIIGCLVALVILYLLFKRRRRR